MILPEVACIFYMKKVFRTVERNRSPAGDITRPSSRSLFSASRKGHAQQGKIKLERIAEREKNPTGSPPRGNITKTMHEMLELINSVGHSIMILGAAEVGVGGRSDPDIYDGRDL